jgi:flagellar biogenesis protein FliO
MTSKTKKPPNSAIFFMIGAMFIVLGIVANRGFLVIGITFLVIGMVSIGRQSVHFLEEAEERIDEADDEAPMDEADHEVPVDEET